LVKSTEYWDGGDEIKFTATITNGNLTNIVYKPTSEGSAWTKVLTYASGENVAGIHQVIQQAEVVNDWQAQTGLFGKPNTNINTKVEKSTGSTTNITYEFNDDNQITKLTRSGGWGEEIYDYTYYEN
jgi:hypothetical protein